MSTKTLVNDWFTKWQAGQFRELPISDNFRHTSPFGTIEGKPAYLTLVEENQDKFLGYQFHIHDQIVSGDSACVRYTASQGDFVLDVSEWYYTSNGLIDQIIAYYHIGDIRQDRQLNNLKSG